MCRSSGVIVLLSILSVLPNSNSQETCNLSAELKREIASYRSTVERIIDTALNGAFRNVTYNELATFADKFGHRLSGSETLEDSIDYMINKSVASNLENVHGENVSVPHWIRGSESATLIEPRNHDLHILGLGRSVSTPSEGILAEVLVVRSFAELQDKATLAQGKIVVYNQEFISYGVSVVYRSRGAIEAAKVGAVASLIKSVGPYSLSTPHTGNQNYDDDVAKIPTASITIEDAHFLQRLQDAGQTIKILLKMEAQPLPEKISRNVIADLRGTQNPEKIVVISGHIDSWDVGAGVMDDGGGVFISWAANALLRSLDLRPKRTIRSIFWTSEEFGLIGANAYAAAHADDINNNYIFMMEADSGTFNPVGLDFAAGHEGGCILEEIMKLLAPLNATKTVKLPSVGSDISIWTGDIVPGASLLTENERYFWYHHTQADTMDTENPVALDKNTALWATVAYVIADLDADFPRDRSPGNGAENYMPIVPAYLAILYVLLYTLK